MRYESLFPKLSFNNEKELRANLKECYKFTYKCSECSRIFGSDSEDVDKICPACYWGMRRNKVYKPKRIKKLIRKKKNKIRYDTK